MVSVLANEIDPLACERLVVVGERPGERGLHDELRRRYPQWQVTACDSYLSAVVEAARRGPRAVLACVRPGGRLADAVAGLRAAAGPRARIVLGCAPADEPAARAAGADDYVLLPLRGEEVDRALGYGRPGGAAAAGADTTAEEIARLGEVVAAIDDRPMALVERLAELVRTALGARGAVVVVEGASATAGEAVTRAVLSAELAGPSGVVGQILVGDRGGRPYAPEEVRKLTQYAGVASRLLAAAQASRKWQRMAYTDECSGLPNRRYLHERLDAVLARAGAERFPVTVLLFDVDDFKTHNDTYGHDAGDEIIRQTGELFRGHCREHDIVTRYGGDEFAVVFWDPEGSRVAGSAHPGCALNVLDRFTAALKAHKFPRLGPAGVGRLTISGGLATYPWDGATREALIHAADQALLAAKRAGKNRILLIGNGK